MRFDIIFYLLGIVCFITAAYIPFYEVNLITAAFIIVLLLFGLFFIAFGYSARPRKYKLITRPKPIEPKPKEQPLPLQLLPKETSKPHTKLTKIKGIGPKRIVQLKTLQILSVEDLTRFSAEDLAAKLKISSKTTAKWIEQAQNLLKETS